MLKPKKRGDKVRLKPTSFSGDVVKIKVVMYDSTSGYLGMLPDYGKDCEWKWFNPKDWEEAS
tara:strand:- start:128 stop:313 length:186 start_codon:yes stop_codon:yes gene_type:complete